jgi:hypothetical protein
MKNNNKLLCCCLLAFFFPSVSFSAISLSTASVGNHTQYPFYAGLTIGYGTTTWGELVAPVDETMMMLLSTPTKVDEGGTIGGAFIGYELFPSFDIELSYMHYANARIFVDPMSLITYDYGVIDSFVSRTNNYSLVGKFLVPIPHSKARIFSSIGPAVTHRQDVVYDHWRLTAAFNVGFDIDISERLMMEIGGNYTAGTGKSEIDPIVDYIPFLYSGYGRLAWRF